MIELIPAIDLIDGKCVRLTKGDYATQKTYNEDPVAVAREFESYGFKRLHVVDLDGARSKHIVNHKVLERLAFGHRLDDRLRWRHQGRRRPPHRLRKRCRTGHDRQCGSHPVRNYSSDGSGNMGQTISYWAQMSKTD